MAFAEACTATGLVDSAGKATITAHRFRHTIGTQLAEGGAPYLDYVVENYEGCSSIVKAAQGGNEALRRLYDEARTALTDRIFTEEAQGEIVEDTPGARLMVRGWAALTEELVLAWAADPTGATREQLLEALAGSSPALIERLH